MNRSQIAKCVVLLSAAAGFLSADAFLDMGSIKGDSQVKGFEKQIVIEGFSYGGDVKAKASGFNAIELDKKLDSASPKILEAAVKGTHLPEVILSLASYGESGGTYARMIMKDVVVTEIQMDGSADEIPDESITLQFDRAEWCQRAQLPAGGVGPEVCTPINPPK